MKTKTITRTVRNGNLIVLLLMGFFTTTFAEDVTVTVKALRSLQYVSLDSILVENESNGSTLALGNLPQNVTAYTLNLNTGNATGITAVHSPGITNKIELQGTRNGFILKSNLDSSIDMVVSIYSLSGCFIESKSITPPSGTAFFSFILPSKSPYIIKVASATFTNSYKVFPISQQTNNTISASVKSLHPSFRSALASSQSFTYSIGDRITVSVKKSNIKSKNWSGQPINGSNIILALSSTGDVFDMTQTLSGGAQTNTISFSGVAFFSGCFYASTFYPPGKVADYFGFQYMRDNDPDASGHNTDYLTKIAYFMMHVLTTEQIQILADLATQQQTLVNNYAYGRLPIIKGFHRALDNDIPSGKTKLCYDSVKKASHDLYLIDGEISYQRAKAFSTVIKSMTQTQKDTVYKWAAVGMKSWPMPNKPAITFDKNLNTLVMTNCSEMYAWLVGNITSDTYFCPERQGTYFGGFFMKDAPAVGNAGYAIDTSATANKGAYLLDTLLTNTQAQVIRNIYPTVKASLLQMTDVRLKIATELRKFLIQDEINKDSIMSWSAQYGDLDAFYIYTMADSFVQVGRTLTSEEKTALQKLRDLDAYPCKVGKVFIYSDEIDEPVLPNINKLFE